MWRRSPLLTAQFPLTIAIGMGGASALVSLMLALGYAPLPYRDPGQLVAVWGRAESSGTVLAMSGPDLADFADATYNVFSTLGGFAVPPIWLLGPRGATKVRGCYIQARAFSDLGIHPLFGRGVRPADEPPTWDAPSPIWISDRLWKTRYGGSPSVIGETVGIAYSAEGRDEVRTTIAGVLPSGVNIPLPFMENTADVWYLLPHESAATRSRQSDVFFGLGRLRPGVTAAQAQAALTVVAGQLAHQYSFERHRLPMVQSLEAIAQEPARKTMGLLTLGLAFVFLVGCVNLAILMSAEGRRRRREIAVRTVLGASHSRLWSEVAGEKCALTLLSVGLGVAFAFGLLRILTLLVPTAGLGPPLLHAPPLNLVVLIGFAVFALIAALVWSALLVRVANAVESSRTLAAGSGLGYTGFSDSGRGAGRWRLALLAVQAGIGICLLVATALTVTTYAAASTANLGPAPRQEVLLSVSTRDNFIPSDAQVTDFDQQALSRLERLPGTQAIALTEPFPPSGHPEAFAKQGDAAEIEREANSLISVSPGYFRTLGIPILFGRGFDDADNSGSEPVAIISLQMAKQNWSSPEQAVGSEIFLGSKSKEESNEKEKSKDDSKQEPEEKSKDGSANNYKIVGVAGDFTGWWSQKPTSTIYLPLAQGAYSMGGDVILRTSSPRAVAALAPQALAGMAIPATISDVSTMEARWKATLTRPLARMAGMLMLALLGLALSIQGVYAVAAATASARRHELAVRATLGALPGRLVWNLTRDLVLAVIVGAALGVAVSLELRPVLAHWLGSIVVWEAEPIIAAVLLMALAAAAGCYFPARSAARANPADVLRQG
jgi:putative ABC transport system permease protein